MFRTSAPLVLLALVAIVLTSTAFSAAMPAAAQESTPTPTATPRPDERPDACEPNPDARRACALPIDAVSGPFTFVPEGDQDVYSINLGTAPNGLETTVTVRATAGLDLRTTISRADTGAPLGAIASPAISTTLTADLTGWMVIRVENRAPGLSSGQSYRVEVRRTLPPAPAPTPAGPDGLDRAPAKPDALENNYDPQTAAPIGVGVLYDLSFVCPVAEGCPGGDHDYLRFDAKAGMPYLLSTFDLAPGVDTVIDLFGYDAPQGWIILATNDDERPGASFLSTLRWKAPGDGAYLVRVGPRDGGLQPILTGEKPQPTYRFAVALAASDLAVQLEERIAKQTNAPRSTAAPTAPPAPTTDPAPASPATEPTPVPITDNAADGQVVITDNALAYTAPSLQSDLLGTLPAGTVATLTGKLSGVWAEISAPDLVGNAWVDRRLLRKVVTDTVPTPITGDGTALPAPAQTAASTSASAIPAGRAQPMTVRTLPSPLQPTPVLAREPVTIRATVSVVKDGDPIAGMRVQLVDIFDTILVELVTGQDGTAILITPATPGHALFVLVPALGVRERINAADPSITMSLTGGRS